MEHRRCPRALTDDATIGLVESYAWLDRYGVLPIAGGMLDQHPKFLQAVRLIERTRDEIVREEEERKKRVADQIAAAARAAEAARARRSSRGGSGPAKAPKPPSRPRGK
jgi:hypothetical protein